jgi:hypothetical protein
MGGNLLGGIQPLGVSSVPHFSLGFSLDLHI